VRVVLATDHFPPHRSGHAVAVAWWARALATAGHAVTVVSDAPPAAGAAYRALRVPTLPGLAIGHPLAALRPMATALAPLRDDPPDVLHLHGYGPLCRQVQAALPGTRAVLSLHQFPDGAGAPRLPGLERLLGALLEAALARSAQVTVPSEAARRKLRAGWRRDATVVPTGVAAAFLGAPARPPRPAGPPRFLYVGRRSRDKNFGQFVRLARAHPEADWVVLGDGPIDPGSQVRCVPRAAPVEVVAQLQLADALLAPSLHETQGLAVLEALTVGTAAAVPRGTAQAELLREGASGAGYAPGDDADAWRALRAAADLTRAGRVRPPARLDEARLVAAMVEAYAPAHGG